MEFRRVIFRSMNVSEFCLGLNPPPPGWGWGREAPGWLWGFSLPEEQGSNTSTAGKMNFPGRVREAGQRHKVLLPSPFVLAAPKTVLPSLGRIMQVKKNLIKKIPHRRAQWLGF